MKKSHLNRITLGLLCAGALLVGTFTQSVFAAAPAAAPAGGEGRLTITRSPKLGSNTFISVIVDGKKVGSLGNAKRYSEAISVGKHTVTLRFEPISSGEKPANVDINVAAGQTYSYSATIAHGDIAFVKNR